MFRTLPFLIALFSAIYASAAEPLKVVTYNIRYANPGDGKDYWPNRVHAVSNVLKDFDLIGLQEVTQLQLKHLRERLGEFDSYGVGRDDGKSRGEHAAIFFRRDRFEVLTKETFWLSETPDRVGVRGWDADLPRTCTWMVLKLRNSEQRIWVANTHFDHRGSRARTESAKLILRMAEQHSNGLPVILMGDFNCLPDSDPYRAITETAATNSSPMADARKVSLQDPIGPSGTWNGFSKIEPNRVIDYLFVQGPLLVRTVEVLDPRTESGRFASDHLPVTASIELK